MEEPVGLLQHILVVGLHAVMPELHIAATPITNQLLALKACPASPSPKIVSPGRFDCQAHDPHHGSDGLGKVLGAETMPMALPGRSREAWQTQFLNLALGECE